MKKNFSVSAILMSLALINPVFNYASEASKFTFNDGLTLVAPSPFDKLVEDLNNIQVAFQDLMTDFNGEEISVIKDKLTNLQNAAGVYESDRDDSQGNKFLVDINAFSKALIDAIQKDPKLPSGLATMLTSIQVRIVQETMSIVLLKVQQVGEISR